MKIEVANIETDVKTLKEYRSELKECKEIMLSVAEGTEEWNAALKRSAEIQHNFNEVNEAVRLSAHDFGQILSNTTNTLAGLAGGVTAVTGVLQIMGVEDTKVAEKTTALMTSLIGITEGLSKLDTGLKAGTTLYKQFKNSTAAATIQNWLFAKSVDGGSKALKGFKTALVTTGIGAIVVALGFAIDKFSDFITSSEKTAEKASGVTSTYLNRIQQSTDAYVEGLLTTWVDWYDEEARLLDEQFKNREITENEYNKRSAEIQKDRLKQYQKVLKNELNQVEFYKDAFDKEGATSENNEKNRTERLIALRTKLNSVTMALNAVEIEETKQQIKVETEQAAAAAQTTKEQQEKTLNTTKEFLTNRTLTLKTALDLDLKEIQDCYDQEMRELKQFYAEGTVNEIDYLELQQQYKDEFIQKSSDSYNTYYNQLLDTSESTATEIASLDNQIAQTTSNDVIEYLTKLKGVYTQHNDELMQLKISANDIIQGFLNQSTDDYLTFKETVLGIYNNIYEGARQTYTDQYTLQLEGLEENMRIIQQLYDDGLISYEEYETAKTAIENAQAEIRLQKEREVTAKKVELANWGFNHTKDIMSAFSEEMDTNNRSQFEANKAMQIATAQVEILQGVITALSGLWTTKTGPWDIGLAATQAGSIITMGSINIAKISRMKYKGSNSSNATDYSNVASINSSALNNAANYTNTIQDIQTATEGWIKDTRVYVVESDITNTQNKVNVVENNSKF